MTEPAAPAISRIRAARDTTPPPQQDAVSSTPPASKTPRAMTDAFTTPCNGEQT
jgi:hypothetical protein